ncbi:hypothetical protein IFT66_10295 [Rhizobium sp. CFBP 13726]|uniref:hypothetical protein n=1 Tax=Rhizobium sp. CFBP 13726 TaxID=2775296 RepID=UPI00178407AB|nr:hypothetical protein [Rhizobium sp. CFBP 13726]MBD8651467.1 hypothetical protein [Rhizobium sp. CFBP 13726]
MYIVSRMLKPIVVAVIMFISLHYLGLSVVQALLVCLIPLALGWLNILTEVGYLLTAVFMMAAIGWAVVPTDVKAAVVQNVKLVLDDFANRDAVTTPTGT